MSVGNENSADLNSSIGKKDNNPRRNTNNTYNDNGKRKFSHIHQNNDVIADDEKSKESIIKEFARRHSWLISVSKLESSNNGSSYVHLKSTLKTKQLEDQGPKGKSKRKMSKHHKGSCDSSTLSTPSNNGAVASSKLKQKAEEVKANNGVVTGNYSVATNDKNRKVVKYESTPGINTWKNRQMVSHKDSKESGGIGTDQLGESVVPPQIIDNSAVLFSNTKRKKGKFKRNNVQNHLQSDLDKSDNEVDYKSVNDDVKKKEGAVRSYEEYEGEGEYDGEGESYTSSCSCSSWLREKNADNGVSLKLSQYSYRPTYADFKKHETEEESQVINMSRFQDDGETSYYNNEKMSTKNYDNNTKGDRSIDDFSTVGANKPIKVLDKSQEFPDNLNNGRFKFQMRS